MAKDSDLLLTNQLNIMKTNSNIYENGHERMSSLEIAELSGKPHNDVMKAIRKMEPAWAKITQGNFSLSEYKDKTGRTLPCYELTKTECLYIATKFNDEARARLVLRWAELERAEWERKHRELLRAIVSVRLGISKCKVNLRALDKAYSVAFPNSTPINVNKKGKRGKADFIRFRQ